MSEVTYVRPLRSALAFFAVVLVCGLPAHSQEGAGAKPVWVLIYKDRDFPNDWIAMSRHPDRADAERARKDLVKIDGIISTDIVPVDPITGKQVPWPADVKKDDQPKGKATDLPKELPPRRSIMVRVYKDGVEQKDKKLETDSDYDRAKDYFDRMNKTAGLKATWNAPGWPRPDIGLPKNRVDIGPYNPLVGTWVTKDLLESGKKPTGVGSAFTFKADGTTDIPNTKWVKDGNKLTLMFLQTGGRWTFTIHSDRLTVEPYREGYVPYDLFKKNDTSVLPCRR